MFTSVPYAGTKALPSSFAQADPFRAAWGVGVSVPDSPRAVFALSFRRFNSFFALSSATFPMYMFLFRHSMAPIPPAFYAKIACQRAYSIPRRQ
jgi:hypothetical protein